MPSKLPETSTSKSRMGKGQTDADDLESLNFKNSEERIQFFNNLDEEVKREFQDGLFSPEYSSDM